MHFGIAVSLWSNCFYYVPEIKCGWSRPEKDAKKDDELATVKMAALTMLLKEHSLHLKEKLDNVQTIIPDHGQTRTSLKDNVNQVIDRIEELKA